MDEKTEQLFQSIRDGNLPEVERITAELDLEYNTIKPSFWRSVVRALAVCNKEHELDAMSEIFGILVEDIVNNEDAIKDAVAAENFAFIDFFCSTNSGALSPMSYVAFANAILGEAKRTMPGSVKVLRYISEISCIDLATEDESTEDESSDDDGDSGMEDA